MALENIAVLFKKMFAGFANNFSSGVVNFMAALLIFFIGFILGKLLGKIIKQVLHHVDLDYFLRKTLGMRISFETIIASFTSYFVYIVSFVMALGQVGLSVAILQMLIGGVIVIIVISVILSIKDFVPNFVAGLMIREKGFINEGDIVQVKDVEGKVLELGIIETILQNRRGDRIFIPNIVFTKNEVINYKPQESKRRNKKK